MANPNLTDRVLVLEERVRHLDSIASGETGPRLGDLETRVSELENRPVGEGGIAEERLLAVEMKVSGFTEALKAIAVELESIDNDITSIRAESGVVASALASIESRLSGIENGGTGNGELDTASIDAKLLKMANEIAEFRLIVNYPKERLDFMENEIELMRQTMNEAIVLG